MCAVRANQNADRPVSTRPLSGIGVGSTTSNVEMRSDATSSSLSSSRAYSSRTLPLPTWVSVSDTDRLLLSRSHERTQAFEDDVGVADVRRRVEDGIEVDASGDLRVGARELREVERLVPRPHRVPLDEPVGVVAGEAGLDEREQQPLAEDET